MKRTHSVTPIRLGKYIAETWRIPVKLARRSTASAGADSRRQRVLPGQPYFIVCNFCGNTIRVMVTASSAASNKGGRR